MQTSVPIRGNKYTAGVSYKSSAYDRKFDDMNPLEDMAPGLAAVRSQDSARSMRLPNMNSYVGVLSGNLVSGDVVTLVGYTETPDGTQDAFSISVTYASSHNSTTAAIETAIEAAATDVAVTRSNSNLTFTMVASADKKIVITTPFTVTSGGAGTATFTNTKGTTDSVRGIVSRNHSAPTVLSLTYTEPTNEANAGMVGVFVKGDPAVVCNTEPSAGDPVYALLEDYTDTDTVVNIRGSFRHNTDSGAAPVVLVSNAEFADVADNSLAPVAINKP